MSLALISFSTTQLVLLWSVFGLLVILLCLQRPKTMTLAKDEKGAYLLSAA